MRQFMTKEVTKTTVKVAVMSVDANGLPIAEKLDDVIMLGNVSLEKAQKEANKLFTQKVTVFGVEPSTEMYKLSVEEFLQHATLVTEEVATSTETEAEPEKAAETETVKA